ncbi:uncharacterized protein [Haliotis asinina]|uniref:uncharacterized protein n=1 Tax=Haliotis asinina TaxID=109174 RepID=UPI0035320B7A
MTIHAAYLYFWCVSLCSGQISHWLDASEGDSYANYKTENTSSWWVAANTVCTRSGGHLFVPRKSSSFDNLTNLLDENKVYWVGGFQYSSLIWTDDNTTYYTRVGYIFPDEAAYVTPTTIDNNSAFNCHLTCGNSCGLFGLKGYHCYCLGILSQKLKLDIVNTTRATEIRCPGDYNDLCGDDKTVTVYGRDKTNVEISPSGRCGYVEKSRSTNNNKGFLTFHLTEDCERKKRFSACKKTTGFQFSDCSGTVCVAKGISTWEEARGDCRLVKVTDANRKNLLKVIKFASHWIGLRRVAEWRWINGIPVELKFAREDISRQCLAARREGDTLSLDWYNCSEKYPAVCQSAAETDPVTTLVTNPGTDHVTSPAYVTVAVAAGVVTVMVVCGISVLMTLKRKRMYCFKIKTRYNRHMGHFPGDISESTSDGQDKTSSDKSLCSLNDGNYCVIDDQESSRLYHHTTAAPGRYGEYDTTRQVQRARRDGSTYNHICTELDLDAADLDDGQYHLLIRERSAGQMSPRTGLYHHVGPGVVVNEVQYDALRRGRSPGKISSRTGQYHHVGHGVAVGGED